MSDLSVESEELQQLASDQDQAASMAGWAEQATDIDLQGKLDETHGVISTESNTAIANKANERQQAATAIQQACQALAAALDTAASAYSTTDATSTDSLEAQMQS